jgi:DNA-binding CsgD family transcriptional regulator
VQLKQFFKKSRVGRKPVLPGALGEPHHLLSTLFKSSTVGVAILDRQLRYRAVNNALAWMHRLPASAHLGKTLHTVLGSAAAKVQPAFEHVCATGRPLSNFEVTAELPSRGEIGHWNASYFPIKNDAGQVQQVGAIVLELTKRKEIEAALLHLTENLTRIGSSLRKDPGHVESFGLSTASAGAGDVIVRSLARLESCMSEARTISQLLNAAPHLTAVQPSHRSRVAPVRQLQEGHGQDFASLHLLQSEMKSLSPLSARERDVVALLAKGKKNKEVASLLLISTRTVESHRARIMLKLHLDSLSDLVRYAVRTDLIRL